MDSYDELSKGRRPGAWRDVVPRHGEAQLDATDIGAPDTIPFKDGSTIDLTGPLPGLV